jgi:hypothetical protein
VEWRGERIGHARLTRVAPDPVSRDLRTQQELWLFPDEAAGRGYHLWCTREQVERADLAPARQQAAFFIGGRAGRYALEPWGSSKLRFTRTYASWAQSGRPVMMERPLGYTLWNRLMARGVAELGDDGRSLMFDRIEWWLREPRPSSAKLTRVSGSEVVQGPDGPAACLHYRVEGGGFPRVGLWLDLATADLVRVEAGGVVFRACDEDEALDQAREMSWDAARRRLGVVDDYGESLPASSPSPATSPGEDGGPVGIQTFLSALHWGP